MINGHLARRNPTPGTVDHVVWDTVLAGFGLQVRASGNNSWIVQYRQRGKLKKVTLGRCVDVDAIDARSRARTMLAAAALDGLPKRVGKQHKLIGFASRAINDPPSLPMDCLRPIADSRCLDTVQNGP